MEITSQTHGKVVVMTVTGSIDMETSPILEAAFNEQINQGFTQLVADMRGIDFASSAGLRALLLTLRQVRLKKGDLRITGGNAAVRKMLTVSGFRDLIKEYETVAEAVASFE